MSAGRKCWPSIPAGRKSEERSRRRGFRVEDIWLPRAFFSVAAQPESPPLSTTDTQGNQRATQIPAVKFLERSQYKTRPGDSYRVRKSDCSAIDVQYLVRYFTKHRFTLEVYATVGFRLRSVLACNHLSGKGFVNFHNFSVRQAQAGLLFRSMNCMHGTQPHP